MSKAMEYIDEQSVIDLTKRLIKNDSLSGNERKIATLLAIEMKKAHFNLVQIDDETNDIIGVLPGAGKGKTLMGDPNGNVTINAENAESAVVINLWMR